MKNRDSFNFVVHVIYSHNIENVELNWTCDKKMFIMNREHGISTKKVN